MTNAQFHRLAFALMALCLIALVAAAYLPGLKGGFLFDDRINLNALGDYGGIRDRDTFLYFLTAGGGDPTGRPVAQLSFLLDGRDWPADPWPFKRTNLLIHILNGGLLLALLLRMESMLSKVERSKSRHHWIALLGTALWLAHPLWVSTTLYIVQRQAMLAATFCLLGLLAWDRTYELWYTGKRVRGWAWASIGIGGATILAGLSKANGFLTPLLVLVLWWVLYRRQSLTLPARHGRVLRRDAWLVLGIPSISLIGYLLWQIPAAIRRCLAIRDFTLAERLLTQPRALMDYMGSLLVPREGSGGVFNDGFVISHGWLEPWSTLPALLSVTMLFLLGIVIRKQCPRLSIALLFFFAAHVIESGPVPLELYFEHRTYLPALLLFWPVAHALLAQGRVARTRIAVAMVLPILLLGLTWQRSLLWGNPPLQAMVWAERNPDSPRALAHAANVLAAQGRNIEAQQLLERAQRRLPGHSVIALNQISQGCTTGLLSTTDVSAAEQALNEQLTWNQGMLNWFEQLGWAVVNGRCQALGIGGWQRLIQAVAANPTFVRAPARQQVLHRLRGLTHLAAREPEMALSEFNHGLDLDPKPQVALAQAADLGNAGFEHLALLHLDHYRAVAKAPEPIRIRDMATLHQWVLKRTGYYQRELDALTGELSAANRESP